MDWFLYDRNLRHDRVNKFKKILFHSVADEKLEF